MKSSAAFLLALISPLCLAAQTLYVSPTGSASNTGLSIAAPTTLVNAIVTATAGTTIYLRGGTYPIAAKISFNKSGTAANPIKLWAYPSDPRPVIDGTGMAISSSLRGVELSGNYCHFKGFDIKKAGDNGLNISGSNNIIEWCFFYENGDSGLQMGGGASNNQVIHCDSYYNEDLTNENADGFAAKLDVGTGNAFTGCRAWQNADDGWDGYLRPADDVSTTLDNCWSFKNGYLKTGSASIGDGNGFKLGGSDAKDLRHNATATRCLSFQNRSDGFDQNSNIGNMTLYNCTSWNNGRNYGMNDRALATGKIMTIKNCISAGTGGQSILAAAVLATNSWTSGFTVTNADFESIDPAAAYGARNADGSLPTITFLHLKNTSTLRNRGTNVGLAFNGTAPDLGAFETTETVGVSLTTVTAKKQWETIVLNWTTTSENNNAYFVIERSDKGLDFKNIGQVKGAGTTMTPQYYRFFDDVPLPNINYYRLKQVDFDGKETLSKIITIDNTATKSGILKMYPSVIHDNLTVDVLAEDVAILRITDRVGRPVLAKFDVLKGLSTVSIPTNGLPNGVYFLSFMTATGVTTERFVKQ